MTHPSHRIILAAAVAFLSPAAVLGETYLCPTVAPYPMPPAPKPDPKVLKTYKDEKGGIWTTTCTNFSSAGDVVWEYQIDATAAKIEIGRCVYVGGDNTVTIDIDPLSKNVSSWRHKCIKPGVGPDGKREAILDIFDKDSETTSRRKLSYDTNSANPKWEEVALRRDTDAAMYASFSPADNNGDGIPDQGFDYLASDIYGPNIPPLPAEYDTRLTLEVAFIAGVNQVTWDIGRLHPTLMPGDRVVLSNVVLPMMQTADPRFDVIDTPKGLQFTAQTIIQLQTGLLLAAFSPAPPGGIFSFWSVEDVGAAAFWQVALHDPRPLEQLNYSSAADFSDEPGYASGFGNLSLLAAPVCCPGNAQKTAGASVNFGQALTVLAHFNAPASPDGSSVGDANCDGQINFADILTVLANFNAACP